MVTARSVPPPSKRIYRSGSAEPHHNHLPLDTRGLGARCRDTRKTIVDLEGGNSKASELNDASSPGAVAVVDRREEKGSESATHVTSASDASVGTLLYFFPRYIRAAILISIRAKWQTSTLSRRVISVAMSEIRPQTKLIFFIGH